MASPTPSWNTVRVFGTWHNLDGSMKAGTYSVSIPVRVVNATNDVIIPAGNIDPTTMPNGGQLQTTNPTLPSLDFPCPATDDPDNNPTGWQVTITVKFSDNSTNEKYTIDVPVAGGPIDLRTITLPQTIPATAMIVAGPKGDTGPTGPAVLVTDNGDGTETVTVNGTPFTLVDNGDGTASLTLAGTTARVGGVGRGITSISRTSGTGTAGSVDTYTITYTDGTTSTYAVVNGANGGAGRGISSITRTSGTGTAGTTDTYTITYTDSTTSTFAVVNGANGGAVATDILFDAKGDLPVGTGDNAAARLPVGANGYSLVADSTQATGVKWSPRSRVTDEVHADTIAVNTTTETTLCSLAIPTTAVAGDVLHLKIWADALQASGSAVTYQLRLKLGATTVLDTGAMSITNGTDRFKVSIDADVLIESTTAQRIRAFLLGQRGTDNWSRTTTIPLQPAVGYGTAAEDLTAGKNLALTVQIGLANANADFRLHGASLEIVKKA